MHESPFWNGCSCVSGQQMLSNLPASGNHMRFNLFSSPQPEDNTAERPMFNPREADAERAALTLALHSMLGTLPESYSGRENIRLLCDEILGASSHLRFVWFGFCKADSSNVEPFAAAGDCAEECSDWNLPSNCFDVAGPASQAFPDDIQAPPALNGLFAPWRENVHGCSVSSALSIPLRAEKRSLRGMMVFYADTKDYFSQMDVSLFQAFCHVAEIIWKQSNLMHMLTQKTQQDPLTGLMNRRQTVQTLEKQMAHAERTDEPLSILICRIKDFNKLNDVYGWLASDAILAAFAKDVGLQLRPQDPGGRWTGIEFLYILPQINAEQALATAKAIQEYFLVHPVTVKNWSIRLALTIGVATYSKQIIGVDDFILHANQSMFMISEELPS
jgi:diguanylate cyclase (GGDEF)-like protein